MAQTLLSWQAHEFEYRPKSADWYWALWIITVAIAVISILLNDILLGLLVIIGAFAISLLSNNPSPLLHYEITASGIRIGPKLYPYDTLQSYNIDEFEITDNDDGSTTDLNIIQHGQSKLIVKSRKLFMSLIIIPLSDMRSDNVNAILEKYLPRESDLHEPFLQKLLEILGF
jgi:hypothetical protein